MNKGDNKPGNNFDGRDQLDGSREINDPNNIGPNSDKNEEQEKDDEKVRRVK